MFVEDLINDFYGETKKDNFLHSLKSTNGGYKRYRGSPIRYPGGKSLAVGIVLEHLPEGLERVVSPFIGGASVEIAIAKELSIPVVAYDVFDLLVNFWQVLINQPEVLYSSLRKLEVSKDEYNRVKDALRSIWGKDKLIEGHGFDPLDLATYYYFNHNLSYGPSFMGWMSNNYLDDPARYENMLDKIRNFKADGFEVHLGRFETTLPKHKEDFLYLDPPYYLQGDSKMFKGIYPTRNAPVHHNNFDHAHLSNLLKEHKGGFILSYNDCSWVREAYKEFKMVNVEWQYTMGQGETRIGKNRLSRTYDKGNIKTSHEILILG